jgi:hypothetical protein
MPRIIPTNVQVEKLPVWAQEHIRRLERERDSAVEKLMEFKDEQTETNVYIQDHVCIGEGTNGREKEPDKKSGPTFIRRYLQTNRVQFRLPRSEMELEVYVNEDEQRVEVRTPRGYPYIEPHGNNLFHLVPKEDMFLNPDAVTLCAAAVDAPRLNHDAFVRKYGFSQFALEDKIKQVVPKSHWKRAVAVHG